MALVADSDDTKYRYTFYLPKIMAIELLAFYMSVNSRLC